MKAAILSVGTELLMGEITNTNAVYLSQHLNDLGYDVLFHHTVGDNPQRLTEMIEIAFRDCDLIVTTGGLGPTQDDLTKEVVCQVMGDHLVMHEEWLTYLEERFQLRGRRMTDNNRKQALLPSRAVMLRNDVGTAPGFLLADTDGKRRIACMPGPPREMTWLFENRLQPLLEQESGSVLVHRMIRTFGIGESQLETKLLDLIDSQSDPTLATYAKEGECALRIASKRTTQEAAQAAVDAMTDQVRQRIGEYIYSYEDRELVQVVSDLLVERGLTISSAESCTGGMFAAALTDVPGISRVFDRSLVTYSNEAKMQELGVSQETLAAHGAVSEETALEMAEGIRRVSGSDIGISVTGIAGPDGGSQEKPVGTVYIGFVCGDRKVCRLSTWNTRNRRSNRRYAVLHMLDVIRKELEKNS